MRDIKRKTINICIMNLLDFYRQYPDEASCEEALRRSCLFGTAQRSGFGSSAICMVAAYCATAPVQAFRKLYAVPVVPLPRSFPIATHLRWLRSTAVTDIQSCIPPRNACISCAGRSLHTALRHAGCMSQTSSLRN